MPTGHGSHLDNFREIVWHVVILCPWQLRPTYGVYVYYVVYVDVTGSYVTRRLEDFHVNPVTATYIP